MSADLFHIAYKIEGEWYESESPMTKAAAEEMFWATEWKVVSEAKAGAGVTRTVYQTPAPQWESPEFQEPPDDFFDAAPADGGEDPTWRVIRDDVESWPERPPTKEPSTSKINRRAGGRR